jgi:hypothetical protein
MRSGVAPHIAGLNKPVGCYSIQEKDFPNTKVKQPGPIRLAGCRARVFLPVYE